MDPAELVREIKRDLGDGRRPFAVVGNAGTTNTGAVDPLASIAEIARTYSLWYHVDAAYGGFAAVTERGRRSLSGIEQADSVVLDPHKWFYCPFEAGCVLVRDGGLMRETFRIMPEYMVDVARQDRDVNFCDYGLQLTRSFRALKVWMALKTYGARRFRQTIERCLDLTQYAARWFERSPRIELTTRPQLGIFTFRYVPDCLPDVDTQAYLNRLNERLVTMIIASRKLMLSSTRLGSQTVLRFCVLNHRTRKEDIKEALRIIEELGREAQASLE
jgi:glutamate/tyrosine decarboxylase-like PLP-dependent enzyme